MLEWINDWIEHRNDYSQKSVLVFNRRTFETAADITRGLDDVAYISISASEECAKEFFHDITEKDHYLKSADNVLNLEFDDITEDFTFTSETGKEVTYHTISEQQAEQVIDFVENNLNKHIILHCRAGKSRSAAVAVAITTLFPDNYAFNVYNRHNQCSTPNPDVLAKVKRAFYKKNGMFQ